MFCAPLFRNERRCFLSGKSCMASYSFPMLNSWRIFVIMVVHDHFQSVRRGGRAWKSNPLFCLYSWCWSFVLPSLCPHLRIFNPTFGYTFVGFKSKIRCASRYMGNMSRRMAICLFQMAQTWPSYCVVINSFCILDKPLWSWETVWNWFAVKARRQDIYS